MIQKKEQKRLVQHGLKPICSQGQTEVIFIFLSYLVRKPQPVFNSNLTKIRSVQQKQTSEKVTFLWD